MTPRKFALVMIASASVLTACDDPALLRAQLPTVEDVYTVFALTGTPAAYPSGLNTYARAAVRVDGNAGFDVAFDIDQNGNAVLYPVQKIVSTIGGTRKVGLRKVSGDFGDVLEAPSGTYADSTIIAAPGDVVIVQSTQNGAGGACQFDISPFIYTKILVDSIAVDTKTVVLQTVLDPNCGFKSFEAGIPGR
ncbi:MAG TPA: hypothetical protein VFD22_14620 [Gemmatimonadaceae bacterium]|nr:hypothetical protein [Gemmatimonadaceae bacterium]